MFYKYLAETEKRLMVLKLSVALKKALKDFNNIPWCYKWKLSN